MLFNVLFFLFFPVFPFFTDVHSPSLVAAQYGLDYAPFNFIYSTLGYVLVGSSGGGGRTCTLNTLCPEKSHVVAQWEKNRKEQKRKNETTFESIDCVCVCAKNTATRQQNEKTSNLQGLAKIRVGAMCTAFQQTQTETETWQGMRRYEKENSKKGGLQTLT